MKLTIQEVHYYNNLVKIGKALKINCPIDETDIVVSKLDEEDRVFFYCISCKTSFYPGLNTIEKIKHTINTAIF